MTQENKQLTETADFDEKFPAPSSSKDLWLFLIILDVILLCAFGFFLYKNLSTLLLSPQRPIKEPPVVEEKEVEAQMPTPAVEEVLAEQVVPVSLLQATPTETITVAQEPVPAVVEEQPVLPVPQPTAPAEKKQSVVVKVVPKSKYRQVTFRYFDSAKQVAVVSGFTMAKPRALTKKKGVWEVTLAISPGKYKYLFVVDGKQQTDPYAKEQDGRSVLIVE